MDRAKKANKQVNEICVFQKGNITDDESLAYVSKISMYNACWSVKTEFLKTYVFECKCFFFSN